MTYTNLTGINIGNCLTGFGIHFPVTIINSGNSEVFYSIKNSNQTNFLLTTNSLDLDASSDGSFDILYCPTITATEQNETTNLVISSYSTEDGTPDPSGDITIQVTGSSLTGITGGNPRAFRVLKSYNINDGIKYDFYWKHPTGITGQNLCNYFITGYTLDFSSNSNFSSILASKQINIGQNTNSFPKYSTFYGFGNDDIFVRIDKNDISNLQFDTSYYARLYSVTTKNTGVSVYAYNVNSVSEKLPDNVFVGYSGTPIDIKIEKQPLNVYINANTYSSTFDLSAKIIETNDNSTDFSFYSGINIYLPENSTFQSIDPLLPAIKLEGSYDNFTGKTNAYPNNDTVINIYVPSTTNIYAANGYGGTIKFDRNVSYEPIKNFPPLIHNNTNIQKTITDTNALYANNDKYTYDSSNGGNCLSLKLQTKFSNDTVPRKDIKYYIHKEIKSSLYAGGGGSKAGIFTVGGDTSNYYFYGIQTNAQNSKDIYPFYFPVNGNLSKTNFNVSWNVNYVTRFDTNAPFSRITVVSSYPSWGEVGSTNCYYYFGNYYFAKEIDSVDQIPGSINFSINQVDDFLRVFTPVNTTSTNRQPGYLIDSYSESSVKYKTYNNVLPSDYIFRFPNSKLNSNTEWKGGPSSDPEKYTLSSASTGTRSTSIESINFNNIKLTADQNMYVTFPSNANIDCTDFDLYFVCAFENITSLTSTNNILKFFDWFSVSDNITSNQIYIYQLDSTETTFTPKDNLAFYFKNKPLFNYKDSASFDKPILSTYGQADINKISKPLANSKNYRPFIINIRRIYSVYYIFLNNVQIATFDAVSSSASVGASTNQLINNLNSTTFKLTNSGSFGVYYFDIIAYNRVLNLSEQVSIYNYLVDQYLSLFAGENSITSLDLKSSSYSYRLPNIFNLAGKS